MTDKYGNNESDYPVTLFTVTYKGKTVNYVMNGEVYNDGEHVQWDCFNMGMDDSFAPFSPIVIEFEFFTREIEGSFYDRVNELRKAIKQKFSDAIVSEMKVERDQYNSLPHRPFLIDDSEVLESIRRGDYTPNEDT